MKTFKLYDYWRSSAAFRVRIALNLKGVDYEAQSVHLVKNGGEQHLPAFRALNPQERVPVLEINDGSGARVLLTQSLAIMDYLDESFPEPPFYPAESIQRARVKAFALAVACDIHPLNNLSVLQYLSDPLKLDENARQQWYEHWIAAGFTALEKSLAEFASNGPYCFGEQVSVADICLIPQVYNALRFRCPVDDYPKLMAVYEYCIQQPAFKQAMPENQPDAVVL